MDDKTQRLEEIHASALAAIIEMVTPLLDDDADDDAQDEARELIAQDPLSVMVRDGWRMPGAASEGAEEFEILLGTGGPAVRIIGTLDRWGQACDPVLQVQDWFTPWTEFPTSDEGDEALRTYCAQFYFEE